MADLTSMLDLQLFTGATQHENFCRLEKQFPCSTILPSTHSQDLGPSEASMLPETYRFGGADHRVEEFLLDTDTAALLVLRNGRVRIERYALTGGPEVRWISMSVAKSFVSALVGIALAEGHIAGLDEPISDYVQVDRGSAYDGVSIRNVLRMSSGARWNEDYSDPESDIFRLSSALAHRTTLDEFVATMVPDVEPGTLCRYNSGDTQALGALLARATGRSVTDYMREKLAEPLGFTSSAHWLVDGAGTEMAYAGLLMTARDFAKFGELYRLGGRWNDVSVVPETWVRNSTTVAAPHLAPGKPMVGNHAFALGYGYQWWIPAGERRDFSAIGVYNQFVYVDPTQDVTIVKLSANRRYGTDEEESTNREAETIAFLRAISDSTASG